MQFINDPVAVKRLVRQQRIELDPINQRGDAHGIISVSGEQFEVNEVSKCVRERKYFGR